MIKQIFERKNPSIKYLVLCFALHLWHLLILVVTIIDYFIATDQYSLRNGKYGVVHLRRYGATGEFCGSFWSDQNSNVLCRQLGYGGGKAAFYSRIRKDKNIAPILGSVDCNGTESSLSQCAEKDPFICYSSQAAGAICYQYSGTKSSLHQKLAPFHCFGAHCALSSVGRFFRYVQWVPLFFQYIQSCQLVLLAN